MPQYYVSDPEMQIEVIVEATSETQARVWLARKAEVSLLSIKEFADLVRRGVPVKITSDDPPRPILSAKKPVEAH